MRHLGIDYGTKKIGLALSDEEGRLAFPHSVIQNDGKSLDTIVALIHEHDVKAIVCGLSQNFKGEDNPVMVSARAFAENLAKEVDCTVRFEPEFLTSVEARRYTAGELVDASAAAIILQSFLDKRGTMRN